MTEIYFETLASAVDGAARHAAESGAVLVRPCEINALCQDHLAYGDTRTGNYELETLKGKPTRKYFHVVICRLDSGRYELTTYVL